MKLIEYIISKLQARVVVVVIIENVSMVYFFLERSINILIFFLLFWICDNLCATRVNLATTRDTRLLDYLRWDKGSH